MSKISGTRFTTSSPFRFALLLIPFAIAAILGIYTVGNYEGFLCLWWAFILVIFGIATLPLAARLWGNSTSGGFFLSQPLGLQDQSCLHHHVVPDSSGSLLHTEIIQEGS